MTSENQQRKLEELEAEINQSASPPADSPIEPLPQRSLQDRWNSLPTLGKGAIAAIALFVAFSLLTTVLRLVTSLLSVAVLGVVLYLLYKFLIAPRSSEPDRSSTDPR